MATPTKYTYSLTTDFTGLTESSLSTTALTDEIRDSSISIALDYINTSGDDCDIWFKDALVSGDQTTLNTVVADHTGVLPIEEQTTTVSGVVSLTGIPTVNLDAPHTSLNVPRVAIEKPDNTFITLYTHNWCDKTTWYENSTEVVSGLATDNGDHLSYSLAYENIIDTYHGKLTQEDYLTDTNNHSYRVSVWVDGEEQIEEDPHTTSGDFNINYASGIITFNEALTGTEEVTATYHYASNGKNTIAASAGKILTVEAVEVQISEDIEINDTLRFTIYGYVDVFAPQLLIANGGPYPPGTKIPLANSLIFKTMADYFNDTIKAYPKYPAMGGSSWRGMAKDIYVMDWDYIRSRVLYGDYGMEIRIELDHNVEFGGALATATFYCTTQDV